MTFDFFGTKDDETTNILLQDLQQQNGSSSKTSSSLEQVHKEAPKTNSSWLPWVSVVSSLKPGDDKSIETLVEGARAFTADNRQMQEVQSTQQLESLQQELKSVMEQLKSSFSHLDQVEANPLSFVYYLEKEDSVKTPSWKRRKHRFTPYVDVDTLSALHDALYLAELAYVDTVEEVQQGLLAYQGAPYELIYSRVEGRPREPAHFIALKQSPPTQSAGFFPWDQGDSLLELLLVVRGTKEMPDVVSDALLKSCNYRTGQAHDGICQSGAFLVKTHLPLFEHLLKESGKSKLRIELIGHSLGAGAAAIACMEFNDHPQMVATCIGFGCPALVSKELSQQLADRITTIVSDSDCVPRMSAATVANMFLNVMANDWTDAAVRDVENLLAVLNAKVPFDIPKEKQAQTLNWVQTELSKKIQPAVANVPTERQELVLYPPGKCIHLFRDGVGVSATYVSCDFFNELDVTRTMVDDHLTSGYDRIFTDLMRGHMNDSKFCFRHDVMGLRIEKKADEGDGETTKK